MAISASAAEMIFLSTMPKYSKGFVDSVFTETPLLNKMNGKADRHQSGTQIETTYLVEGNNGFEYFSGYGTLGTDPTKGLAKNAWNWQQWHIPVSLCRYEELINSGPEQIVDLLKLKLYQARKSAEERLNVDILYGTGNINQDDEGQFWGLDILVGDEASDVKVLGTGLTSQNAATSAWFRSLVIRPGDDKVLNNTSVPVTDAASVASNGQILSLDHLDTPIDSLDEIGPRPEVCLATTKGVRGIIRMLQQQGHQVLGNSETLRMGVDSVVYRGVEYMAEKRLRKTIVTGASSQRYEMSDMFYVNFDDWKMFAHSSEWFTQTPWVTPHNQAARYMHILGMGNLCVKDRRHLGRLNNVLVAA